jgi:hypothetical protein
MITEFLIQCTIPQLEIKRRLFLLVFDLSQPCDRELIFAGTHLVVARSALTAMPVNKTKASGSLASVCRRLPTHQQIAGMGGAAHSAKPV